MRKFLQQWDAATKSHTFALAAGLIALSAAAPASAQSFRVQCPNSTITHPVAQGSEPAYAAPT